MKKLFGSKEKGWAAHANAFARAEAKTPVDKVGNRTYELNVMLKPAKAPVAKAPVAGPKGKGKGLLGG